MPWEVALQTGKKSTPIKYENIHYDNRNATSSMSSKNERHKRDFPDISQRGDSKGGSVPNPFLSPLSLFDHSKRRTFTYWKSKDLPCRSNLCTSASATSIVMYTESFLCAHLMGGSFVSLFLTSVVIVYALNR